jgi:hypothetical protein
VVTAVPNHAYHEIAVLRWSTIGKVLPTGTADIIEKDKTKLL